MSIIERIARGEVPQQLSAQHNKYFRIYNIWTALENMGTKDIAKKLFLKSLRNRDFENAIRYGQAYRYISIQFDKIERKNNGLEKISFYPGENGSFRGDEIEIMNTNELLQLFGIESEDIDFEIETVLVCDFVTYAARAHLDCRTINDGIWLEAANKIVEELTERKNMNSGVKK